MIKLKTPSGKIVEFGDWQFNRSAGSTSGDGLWFRGSDLKSEELILYFDGSRPKKKSIYDTGYRQMICVHVDKGRVYHRIPWFFTDEREILIETWSNIGPKYLMSAEEAKQTIDNFISLFD